MKNRSYLWYSLSLFIFYFISSAYINVTNDGSHFAMLGSIVNEHSLELSPELIPYTEYVDIAYKNGKYYSDRLPGTAIATLPFYYLSDLLVSLELTTAFTRFHNPLEIFSVILPNALGSSIVCSVT